MNRRRFLATSSAAAALANLASGAAARAQAPAGGGARQYYELRRYHLLNGPQKTAADAYFRDALMPALNRQGIAPVGAFNVSIGPQGSSAYLLLPGSAEALVNVPVRLAADAEYQKAAASFLNAPMQQPGFVRMENGLFSALDALPRLTPPPTQGARLFELRTYESTTWQDHLRKVEMVNVGELPIFKQSGFWPIFMGDAVIGDRQPNLTYMIGFPTLADRDKYWAAFFGSDGWKALTSNPRYNFETLVANVDNQILTPAAYSQI